MERGKTSSGRSTSERRRNTEKQRKAFMGRGGQRDGQGPRKRTGNRPAISNGTVRVETGIRISLAKQEDLKEETIP